MPGKRIGKAVELLRAGDWEGAHVIAQAEDVCRENPPLAYWAHAIVHQIEGDEPNARYWYRRAEREFPGMEAIDAEIDALDARNRAAAPAP